MKGNKITFLLTLKDRSEYTENWLKNNYNKNFNFLIADGSIGDENKNILLKYQFSNLKYKHYGVDETVLMYINKIINAIKDIDTEYIMMCDNDDYINFIGIDKCIKALDNNIDYTCAGGTIYSIFENNIIPNHYNLPIPFLNNSKLHSKESGFSVFKEVRRDYKYLYYSVFRKNDYKKIFEFIYNFQIKDLFLIEMLHNDLTLLWGKYFDIGQNHYIRLMNTNKSGANSYGSYYHKRIFFNNSYREEINKLNILYSELFKKQVLEIEEIQTNFYLWYFNQPPRVKNIFYRKIHGLLIKFPFFKIKTCINFVNTYFFLKNKINA